VTILNNQIIVGSELSLKCDTTTVKGITRDVNIVWMKNGTIVEELNSGRISTNNNSILQFSYLSENDKGTYVCNATILGTNVFESVEVELDSFYCKCAVCLVTLYTCYKHLSFIVPLPNISVTAITQNIGDPLSLRCNISTVKGITSSVDIVWMTNGRTPIVLAGNVTANETAYVYYYNSSKTLTINDNNTVYQCQVVINTSPVISITGDVTLNVTEIKMSTDITFGECK